MIQCIDQAISTNTKNKKWIVNDLSLYKMISLISYSFIQFPPFFHFTSSLKGEVGNAQIFHLLEIYRDPPNLHSFPQVLTHV